MTPSGPRHENWALISLSNRGAENLRQKSIFESNFEI